MRTISALVIAGTHSGIGKTTISFGLMAALRRRGMRVQPFKIGPDFIDPGLHAKVCGTPSHNLDGWILSKGYNHGSFVRNVQDKDVAVVEGMMGLYDGRSGATEEGSTAEMAKQLQRAHPMVGVFPFKTRMLLRLQALDYREVMIMKKAFAAPGERIRGHEFHYSEIHGATGAKAIDAVYVIDGQGKKKVSAGYRYKNCLGSYVHLHFGSNPKFARSFVAACRAAESECLG